MTVDKEYGLIGFPLGHSFSKSFFEKKFDKEGLSASYSNFEIEDVRSVKDIITERTKLRGFNVTIPHKQNIIALLDTISDEAKSIGAVNVVKLIRSSEGIVKLKGFNSDVIGFTESIKPLLTVAHTHALVLGTGGASKAVVYGLKKLGIETQLVSRTSAKGILGYNDLDKDIIGKNTIVVNCTPLGTYPNVDTYPDIPYQYIGTKHILYDLVYNPEETAFLRKGKEMGAIIKNGYEMLEKQALAAWDIWNRD